MNLYLTSFPQAELRLASRLLEHPGLGDSKNAVKAYCLDVPRFEESLNK